MAFEAYFFPVPEGEALSASELRYLREEVARIAKKKLPIDLLVAHDAWACIQAADCLHDKLKTKLKVFPLAGASFERDLLPRLAGEFEGVLLVAPALFARAWFGGGGNGVKEIRDFVLAGPWRFTAPGSGS